MSNIPTTEELNAKIKRVIITEEEIRAAIEKAGREIDKIYDGRPILLVSILKGSFVFWPTCAAPSTCPAMSISCPFPLTAWVLPLVN